MRWTPEAIRKRREAHGWTQQQLARELGVSVRSVTSWESGDAAPRNLHALDEVLGRVEDTQYGEPLLREATTAELIAEVARRIERAETRRDTGAGQGFSSEDLGVEDGVPPGMLNDPNLIEITGADRHDPGAIRRRQAGASG